MSQTSFIGQPVAQAVSSAIFLVAAIPVLAFATARLNDLHRNRNGAPMKYVTIAVFLTTNLNACMNAFIVYGLGTDGSHSHCEAFIFGTVITYAISKAAHHCFLAERLHLVYTAHSPRLKSPAYWLLATILPSIAGLAVYCVMSRTVELRGELQQCYIGYGRIAPIIAMALSFGLDSMMTVLFLIPIVRSNFKGAKKLASKTVGATIVMLLSVALQYGYVVAMDYVERSWAMSLVTLLDLTLNSCVLYYITNKRAEDDPLTPSCLASPLTDSRQVQSRPSVGRLWGLGDEPLPPIMQVQFGYASKGDEMSGEELDLCEQKTAGRSPEDQALNGHDAV
ncbi:hypothetical protein MNV49_003684 [Pseudohyphozyma bogoriensis]|nr:hypothetical protein MNV49_003684 [Pseudohyphozyma bogoriensis]